MGKKTEGFLSGAEKYPEELLKGRIAVEGNVISCLFKDILLIDEVKLSSKDFITEDAVFYFGLVKSIREKGMNSLDEVTILSNSSEIIINGFEARGGWMTIQHQIDIINDKNFDTYLDILYRENNLLKLYDDGFNLFKKIDMAGKEVEILNILRKMNSEEIVDFYESRLTTLSSGNSSKILEDTNLEITDDFLDSLSEGMESGVPFDSCGFDEYGEEVKCLPYISNQINGYSEGTLNMIGGFSSSGKTTLWVSILMGLAYRGKKILIISNEQKSTPFRVQFLIWVINKRLKYFKITKRKLENKDELTQEDKKIIKKAQEIWNEEFKDSFHFIQIADADISLAKKLIRNYKLMNGFDTFLYDTFKLDIDNISSNTRTDLELVKDSRQLDKVAKKYDMIALASVQLGESYRDILFLNASVLSNSKQIKEILESLLLLRPTFQEELDKGNKKFYCNPFQRKKVNGKWIEEEYEPDMTATYRTLFFEKTRSGASSNDNGIALLLKFVGNSGIFKECAFCRPKHSRIC